MNVYMELRSRPLANVFIGRLKKKETPAFVLFHYFRGYAFPYNRARFLEWMPLHW